LDEPKIIQGQRDTHLSDLYNAYRRRSCHGEFLYVGQIIDWSPV
jgi:hypothetical protein